MAETISTYPTQITGIDGEKQAIVLVILAHRTDENGNTLTLTPSQKESALANAKASLEVLSGTEVYGASTALLLPDVELADGETLTLNINTSVVKSSETN